ncbi:hypothetical protein V8G54_034914 [Vigna mungo]|uniref:Uncharacterized protein n=1 Tax=Vigna mungo TaxID=3915 RepID=A0AAQ3ME55_VIGMU
MTVVSLWELPTLWLSTCGKGFTVLHQSLILIAVVKSNIELVASLTQHNLQTQNTNTTPTKQKLHILNDPFALRSLPTSALTLINATAHNGRLRRAQPEFGALPQRGIRGSKSWWAGSEFDGEVQADCAGEASDLEVAVHHDSSRTESDVLSGITGSSLQHEGEWLSE